VLVAGNVVLDVTFEGVAGMPAPELTVAVPRVSLDVGGCGANTARSLAVLGVPVRLVGRVGADAAAGLVTQELTRRGVGLELVEDEGETTGVTGVFLGAGGGTRSFLYGPGANRRLADSDVVLGGAAWLHIGGFFTTERLATEARSLVQKARDAGVPVSVGLAWSDQGLWGLLDPVLPHLDALFLNRLEAAAVTGLARSEASCRALRARGCPLVVVTDGEQPVVAAAEETCSVPAFQVRAVDTTGAGDAFNAGCLKWLHEHGAPRRGPELSGMVRMGSAAGALSCAGRGGLGGLSGPAMELLLRRS
jgi:sugar/nucleoside kinase (ribokinase family)